MHGSTLAGADNTVKRDAPPAASRHVMARRLVWGGWALIVVALYYSQLWHELRAWPAEWDAETMRTTAKLLAALATGAVLLALAALPIGAAAERMLAWPRLPLAATMARRLAAGLIVLMAAVTSLQAVIAPVVHSLAGAWFPYAGEAASRALTGIFGAMVVTAAALPAGQRVCGWLGWRPDDWRDEVLFYTTFGYGVVAAACGGLALAGFFTVTAIQIVVAVLVMAGAPGLLGLVRRAGHWQPLPARRGWFVTGLQTISGAAVAIAGFTALAPETEYDALWYHLGLPKAWLEAGRPVDLVHEYVSLYPLTWELVFTAGLTVGGPVSAGLLHFVCLPLAALLVWQLSKRLVPAAEPWVGVAIFVTVPTVLWEATTAYVDLALALAVGLGFYALLRYADGHRRSWLAMALVSLGLAMAIKHLALVAVALLAPGLVLWLWRREGWPLSRALAPAVVLVLLAVIIPLPWYTRAWIASGNPVFPELYWLFGASPPERWDQLAEQGLREFKARFGVARPPLAIGLLPWDVTMGAARYGGSPGPLFLLLLPALVLLPGRHALVRWTAAFAACFVLVWASPISSFQFRFLVVILPLLAILAAEAARRLGLQERTRTGQVLASALLVLLVLNLPPFTRFHERDRTGWDGWLTHVVHTVPLDVVTGRQSQHDYLARRILTYEAWQFLNRTAPSDALVLTFRGGDHFYSERRRIASVSPAAREAVWLPHGQEDAALANLYRLGITHLLVDRRSLESLAGETPVLSDRMRRENLQLIHEDRGALVFQVQGWRQSAGRHERPSMER